MHTRRHFIRACGAAAVGTGLTISAAERVAAEHVEHLPDDVSLSFDKADLETYEPLLQVSHLEVQPTTIYGWKATSPNRSNDVYVYVTHYPTQRGLTKWDSHYLDREPCYVFVNSNGAIETVLYSAYHWLKGTAQNPPIHSDSTGDHPAFRVADKWHHYLLDPDKRGELVGVSEFGTDDKLQDPDVLTKFEEWLDNQWEEELLPGAVVNPWMMRAPKQESWWRQEREETLREVFVELSTLPLVNLYGAANTDL